MKKAPPTRSCAPRFPNSATNISSVCWWKPRSWRPDKIIIWPWSMKKRETEGECQSSDASRSSENGGVSARRGSRATRLRTLRRFPERSGLETAALRVKNNRITQRADCQVLQLPTERGRLNSRGSLRIVSGLAENTHSIFCDDPRGSETVNGCPVLRRQEPSPRGTRASCGFRQAQQCALLRSARQEDVFLLDKDLHG